MSDKNTGTFSKSLEELIKENNELKIQISKEMELKEKENQLKLKEEELKTRENF